jgi:predicted glycoside hydrolase/deacetylase ChbG (UPF0249 family)
MKICRAFLIILVLAQLAFAQQPSAPAKTVAEHLGYPANSRLLMIHADDFGMLHSVNRAIMTAFEHKWITSASILVPCPWFPEVAKFAREHPDADLGIHLALNSEWTPVRWGPVASKSQVPSLLDQDGYMPLVEEQVVGHAKPNEAEIELEAQIKNARDSGVNVSHLDTHMGTLLRSGDLADVYFNVGAREHLPTLIEQLPPNTAAASHGASPVDRVLQISPGVPPEKWLDAYKQMLAPLGPGVYQLTVHLAYDDDEMRGATADHPNWGAAWRQHDLDMISSTAFQQFLREQGFVLVSWKELAKALERR